MRTQKREKWFTDRRGWAREPIHRMDVNAPAVPRTPSMATATAESRCAEVGVEKLL